MFSVWVWMRVGNGVSRGKTRYLKLGLIHQISSWMKLGKVPGGTNYRMWKEKGTDRIGLSEAMLLVSEWFHRKGKWQDKRRP